MTEFWCKCALMGHVELAGKYSEAELAGGKVGRLDIPQEDGSFRTEFFGAQSIYRISVVSEAVARELASRVSPPVHQWDWPRQLPAPINGTPGSDAAPCAMQRGGFDGEDIIDVEPPF